MRRLQLTLPVADRLRVWQHRQSRNPAIHHQVLNPVYAATFLYDATLAPAPFHGDGGQNAEERLEYFQRYVAFKQLPHDVALPLFALLMRGPENTWGRFHRLGLS